MDYEKAFNNLYGKFEQQISDGELHGDDFDRVDSVMSLIYGVEDLSSGIFYSLDTDTERALFIEDFKNAVQHLQGAQDTDEQVIAELVIRDRKR
jgi:hypothetical protein